MGLGGLRQLVIDREAWHAAIHGVTKQQLEPYMERLTGSKLGKEYIKAVYCHPAYSTYMQSTSCEMLGWEIKSCNLDS